MLNEALSERYASAIYAIAKEQKNASTVLADLRLINSTVAGHAELKDALMSPTIGVGIKSTIAQKVFSSHIRPLSLHFFMLLLKKGREAYLGDIIEIFDDKLNRDRGILSVDVHVATSLDPLLETLVTTNLVKLTGKRVDLHIEVHPELIAGAVIKVGEKFYDGSFKFQLDEMYRQLKKGKE